MRLTSLASLASLACVLLLAPLPVSGAEPPAAVPERTAYVVATAHLDTQWRWTIQDTIVDMIPNTLRGNFALFEKYPDYVFSFEGAFRYALAKEYYPAEYERLKAYVRAGRWKVAGSWVDAVDPNMPSPESLIRHTLYGNGFFRRELGVTSRDVFLPDCFGFGFALPSVAAHCGLTAFSTQKLTWGSSIRVPFDIGLWEGVDGSALVATLNPGDYSSEIKSDISLDPDVYATIDRQAAMSGLSASVRYFGTGDVGVPPVEPSVALLQKSLAGAGPLRVRSVAPDQLARDLMAEPGGKTLASLQRYRGEFLLTSHGAGCYTSQAAMKRYNRTNQRLADAAERASVAADWLGGAPYPRETLREAWTRFLWHQFHDDLTGTSIPEAYTFSWNDEAISANQFAGILGNAAGAVARALDTRGPGAGALTTAGKAPSGVALVVYNPLALAREDAVEADVAFAGGAPRAVQVLGPDGREVPSQIVPGTIPTPGAARIVFLAKVAPLSFSVFHVVPSAAPNPVSELKASAQGLENARYRLTLDVSGDIASVVDKQVGRELLAGPARLQLIEDEPRKWSAWEVEYSALTAPPREVVGGPASVRVVENGPARVALEVVRHAAGSTFTQRIRLAAGGAGDRVEILTDVDWRTQATLLKAAFPLAASSRTATYDLGLGVVERPTNRPNLYEVPAQQWADLTDAGGAFGAAILNDSKHGWDKPDDRTLRLSLIHTPRVVAKWSWLADQATNDLGHHRVLLALAGHAGDWRTGRVSQSADRLSQPLLAWQVPAHPGPLGPSFSLLRLEGKQGGEPPVAVRAVKMAEESDEVVVRMQELSGKTQERVLVRFARPVVALREINGAEEPLGPNGTGGALPEASRPALRLVDGSIELAFLPFRPRTVAVKLGPAPVTLASPTSSLASPLDIPFNLDGISDDDARTDGDFDGDHHTIAGELLPRTLVSAGIPFRTGPRGAGQPNVLVCRGQRVALPTFPTLPTLPPGGSTRIYLVAAAVGGDRQATFDVDGRKTILTVPDWAEPVGQWNSRLVGGEFQQDPARIAPAYAKRVPVAWVGTHRHNGLGENEAYVATHFFRLRIDLPEGARTLTLPEDERVRVLAITAARNENDDAVPVQPFTDPDTSTLVHFAPHPRVFLERTTVSLTSPTPAATIRYTLDGSQPTAASAAYSAPIAIERTTTVKARAFAPATGMDDRFVAAATFTRLTPQAASRAPGALSPGLSCRMYEGSWRKLPDFDALEPVRTLTLPTVSLPSDRPKGHIGLACQGLLSVPSDGLYTLSLRSADESELKVDGQRALLLEDNDFISRRTQLALAAGLHPVELRYFQGGFVAGLELKMDAPGKPLTPVTADRFFHVAGGGR